MSFYAIHFRSLYSSARIFLPAGNGLMEKVLNFQKSHLRLLLCSLPLRFM